MRGLAAPTYPNMGPLGRRAFTEALELGHHHVLAEHFLLAILHPPNPTIACTVLNEARGAATELAEVNGLAGLAVTDSQNPCPATAAPVRPRP